MRQDLRLAFRTLRAHTGFATATLLTLALGIGAATAMFSIGYGVLVRPLPYPDSGRLVRLSERHPGGSSVVPDAWLSNLTYHAWNGRSRTIGPIAAYGSTTHTVGLEEPARMTGAHLSPAAFDVLRVSPAVGRFFNEADARQGATRVVVLSDGLWRERFGADTAAIGKLLIIDQEPYVIVGVAPAGFAFPDGRARLWTVHSVPPPAAAGASGRISGTRAIARLQPGATPAQAAAEGTAVARAQPRPPAAEVLWGKGGPVEVQVRTIAEDMTAGVRPALVLFLVGVACLLLIACANVANLFLSRGVSREREIAVRAALGAGHGRLVRQLMTESLTMAVLGGMLAVVLAIVVVRGLPFIAPPNFPRLSDIELDWVSLLFACVVSMAAGILSGVVPAVKGARPDLLPALRDGAGASTGRRIVKARRALLVAEASLAVTLLIAALLVGRSFARLLQVDPGYEAAGVLAARVYLPGAPQGQAQTEQFVAALLEKLRAVPGVRAAGAGNMAPFGPVTAATALTIRPPGREPATARALVYVVTPGYAEALRLRLVEGRFHTEADLAHGTQSLVVNEAFVRALLRGVEPVGLDVGAILARDVDAEIVGVVRNVLKDGLDRQPQPEVYVVPAHRYALRREINLVVRTAGHPSGLAGHLREIVRQLRPDAALENVAPLASEVSSSVATERFTTSTIGGFAILAVVLAAIGLYGVLSYAVSRRERELGIRTALGASRGSIAWLVIRDGMSATLAGLAIGLVAAAGTTRILQSLLFGIEPLDPVSFTLAPVVLGTVALIACALPAVRAAGTSPALRNE